MPLCVTYTWCNASDVAVATWAVDFKAINFLEKNQYTNALKTAKRAKDKSIYDFVEWKYLLNTNNQASFYDYQSFIQRNNDYPRINRLKY